MYMLASRKFGKLTVVCEVERRGTRRRWRCACMCGAFTVSDQADLLRGHSKSCGCSWGERHGHMVGGKPTPEYRSWASMISRCEDPRQRSFTSYGARGIRVCRPWRRSFLRFLADMGPRPSPGHSLDRINNARGYSASNCRWATAREQVLNRRTTTWVTVRGTPMLLADAAAALGLQPQALRARVRRGGDIYAPPKGSLRVGDECLPVSEWSKRFGVAATAIRARLRRGWDPYEAVSIPHAYRHEHRRAR